MEARQAHSETNSVGLFVEVGKGGRHEVGTLGRDWRRSAKKPSRYDLIRLVYAEHAPTIGEAIAREKAMKKWSRAWKIELIESANPDWDDLFGTINA